MSKDDLFTLYAPAHRYDTESLVKQKETFESVYGQRPTLKSIWAEDERRKKERDAKRKSQWTVPY